MAEEGPLRTILTRRGFLKKGILLGVGLGGLGALAWPFKITFSEGEEQSLYEARYYEKLSDEFIQCQMCFRRCLVPEGGRGFCRNKENRKGKYYTLVYARPSALQIDPIEKEPSFHMLPGINIFCTATASCNNRCKFCHNWHISQKSVEELDNYQLFPEEIVKLAKKENCPALSFTYSEPTVFYEYMFDIAKKAKEEKLRVLYHTNGSINPEPLFALLKYMDAVTVDLKGFSEKFYSEVSSSELAPVLETLKNIKKAKVHLEVVNLVIPTLNDDLKMIRDMCQWIGKNLGKDVPLHLNRFFPAYKLTKLPPTPIETLEKGREIAREEGLQYIYIGNTPGHKYNSTFCPKCEKRLIHRTHFKVRENHIVKGKCKFCNYPIPGVWS
ncbi:MAG: AmmeMemoRadiSam system radical SAM enzyme [Deltaproteobacteria bacterium]|nr:MAG: AmmeMemoRadiSam system radical SAM enzyme [Deltaproteobacteria bacterium]